MKPNMNDFIIMQIIYIQILSSIIRFVFGFIGILFVGFWVCGWRLSCLLWYFVLVLKINDFFNCLFWFKTSVGELVNI